jgi:hypothetical protein
MPGPAMHHMIVDRLRSQMQAGRLWRVDPAHLDKVRALLADQRNLPYLFLGSQGPGLSYSSMPRTCQPDHRQDLVEIVLRRLRLHRGVQAHAARSAVPQPVLDALEAFDEAANELIEDSALLSELQQTFDDLNRLMLTAFMGTC